MPQKTSTTNDTTATATGYAIKNAKVFVAKFLPCTNTRGARVKIYSPVKDHKGKSLTVDWDYEISQKTYDIAFSLFLQKYETYFFNCQAGEEFEITKSYFNGGYYIFTARVAR